MQSLSSKIWTRIVVSNSYDDNHYTTGTSKTITPQAPPECNNDKKALDTPRTLEVKPQHHMQASVLARTSKIY